MVTQLQFENPFLEGVNSVYLLDGGEPTTLIDTGYSTAEAKDRFEATLREEDTRIEDIDQILLTHWHTDHAALAGDIQERSGATVRAHEADAGLASQDPETWERMCETFITAFDDWGMRTDEKSMSLDYVDNRDEYWGRPATIETFIEGETFDVGEGTLRALSFPGHTLGSVCYVFEDRDGVFTGDTLLPGYTPNIGGGEFRQMESLLEEYLSSLRRFLESGYGVAWPGHRGTISTPAVRARAIIQHHWDRLAHVLGVLRNYDVPDVRSLATHLFGSLEELHVFIGCAEAAIHLKYLSRHDLIDTADGYAPKPEADRRLDERFEQLLR